MASHLRFDTKTGRVESRTFDGKHTQELLQLNDDTLVQYRLNTVKLVSRFTEEIHLQKSLLKALAIKLNIGEISQIQYDTEEHAIEQELTYLCAIVQAQTGDLPSPSLPKNRLGISLTKS
jgi:hypothetical protein